jgi:CheY-like chemotaxis protein
MPHCAVILLAEDNADDAFFTKLAFDNAGILNAIHVVRDGEEAIAYLSGTGQYKNRAEYPLPALLLLDLKMPLKNGFEVLTWIRGQPALFGLCTIVLSGSNQPKDEQAAYQLGATSYLTKPLVLDQLVQACGTIQDNWLCITKSSANLTSHRN